MRIYIQNEKETGAMHVNLRKNKSLWEADKRGKKIDGSKELARGIAEGDRQQLWGRGERRHR